MNLIQFRSVSHEYSGVKALDNATFEIEENKITVIIGRSGGGNRPFYRLLTD